MKTLAIIFLLFSTVVSAQNCTVYYLNGEASLTESGKKTELKENTVISKGSTIIVSENTQLVLFKAEKAVVLRDAKNYTYAEIEAMFEKTNRSISDKYIAYLWNSASERDKNDDQSNVNVIGMVSRGGGEGINFPMDSSIITTDAMVLEFDEENLPGYLYIYDRKRVVFRIEVNSATVKMYNTGLMEAGKWFGMALSSEDNANYAIIMYVKWATSAERETIRKEISTFYGEIDDLPMDVRSQLIHAFYHDKRYVGLDD